MRLGADPDDLRRLAAELGRASAALEATALRSGRRLRTAPWRGPDARAARLDWERRQAPAVGAVAGAMRRLSRQMLLQADQQVGASSRSGTSGTTTGAGGVRSAGGAEGRPGAAGAVLGPAPRRTVSTEMTIGGSGAVVTAEGTSALRVDELPGGRVAVTEAGGASVGAGLEVVGGAWGGVDGFEAGVGGSIGAVAQGGVVGRRRWEVDRAETRTLLTQITAERAASGNPVTALAAEARRRVGPDLLVDRTASTEVLTSFGATGGLRGQAGSLGGGAEATGELRVGGIAAGGSHAVVVEYSGSAGAALSRSLSNLLATAGGPRGRSAGAALDLRLVAWVDGPRAGHAEVLVDSTVGERTERVELALARVDDRPSPPDAGRAVSALAAGDVGAAAAALAGGPVSVEEVRAGEGTRTVRGGGVDGGGIVGADLSATSTTTEWRPLTR